MCKKYVLPPNTTHVIEHLGFVFNSSEMTTSITDGKIAHQFVDKLVVLEPVFCYASLYYKEIEIYINDQNSLHLSTNITLPCVIKDKILWWQAIIHDVY